MHHVNVISFSRLYPSDTQLVRSLGAIARDLRVVHTPLSNASGFAISATNETSAAAHSHNNALHLNAALNQGVNLFIVDAACLADPHSRQTIHNVLKNHTQSIHLCLCAHDIDLTQEAEFFATFHDFLVWPCSQQEMQTRFYRFLKKPTNEQLTEAALLAEFSRLHLTGASPIFLKTISLIKKMANCHASVLIQGETGTGKENAARAIHYLSARRDCAFIPINCAAIPDELIESELFGHEKGAFTDAKTTQLGLVSLAQGGTLFLDEVDSLTPKAQATLLRFLQTQEYRPLGAKTTSHADVRILAATNANLRELSQQKSFREDLYFRLNVLHLYMPPLRERVSDIPLLADALLEKFALQHKIPVKKIHPVSLGYLMQQRWNGNIRELENVLLRSFLLSSTTTLIVEPTSTEQELTPTDNTSHNEITTHTPAPVETQNPKTALSFQEAKAQAINHFEKHYLQEIMAITAGNVSAAARLAGKERRALGKLLQKYQIQKSQFQHAAESA